ncbi:SAM-dependent methyltransferase [Arthrobacter sp. UCD-GKA]|uniref:class I SAM-dependent methyltransferase n=1 Tax=Arthrobacter sp. UCD-GKA TaxID=1913576 RepID=UPI0008DCB725|nr:class I SAM-dependent methyltransferase [Arthrobacter sp. UCD-GKA]OIH86985.1 SAM-dependent methyltransferase [Arthrobacter sp. UCD-GKA]
MDQETKWQQQARRDPAQARNYIGRFAELRASGADLDGEARFADAMLARGSRVLDAGCGTGRVGGELAARGHRVTGVDLDAELLAAARTDFPGSRWLEGNLATLDVRNEAGERELFELVMSPGNVLAFVAPGTAATVLGALAEHLAPDGRLVVGFSPLKGYALETFEADAAAAGLRIGTLFSTWDMRPLRPGADFVVALLEPARTVN